MSLGTQIAWDDSVLPFQLDRAGVRGRFARLGRILDQVLSRHDHPSPVAALLAEAVLLTALIGQMTGLGRKLSLQAHGSGPVRLIATDYFGPAAAGETARLRAYANCDDGIADGGGTPFDRIGEGHFGILVDQGDGAAPYQGITPISGRSLSACAETYFAQSEQLPTRFALALGRVAGGGWRAGGMMIQHMPGEARAAAEGGPVSDDGLLRAGDLLSGDDEENWNRANILLDTARDDELAGPDAQPTEVLVRLFHEEAPRVFDPQPLAFGCTCSADRAKGSLSGCSAEEIAGLVTEAGVVTADCQFCGAHYEFDPSEVGAR